MAGLACGIPSDVAYSIISAHAVAAASVSDWVTKVGMWRLAHPLDSDPKVVSGTRLLSSLLLNTNLLSSISHFVSTPLLLSLSSFRRLLLSSLFLPLHPLLPGESGAVPFGLALALLSDPRFKSQRDSLGLDASSRILCVSTEGATDPDNWRKITSEPGLPSL